ncbi:MAG: DUF3784 domain-containing protein [Eubacteriales bacterium]
MAEWIGAILCGVIAAICLIVSVMQFAEKGVLFNNAYIWASKQERDAMDKKPHYRQSGIVFAFCAALFCTIALECILKIGWLWLIEGALLIAVLVYAVVSSVKEQKK